MTFRVNARKSHSERRETLTPCLDWFSSASSRVRCSFFSFLFSFLFSSSPRVSSVRSSSFEYVRLVRVTFLSSPVVSSFPSRRSFYSPLLRAFTLCPFFLFFSVRVRVRPFLSLSLPLPCSVTLLLSLASRTRLSPSRFYFSPKQTSRWKRRAGGRKEGRRRKGEKRVTRQKRKKEAERE